MAFLSQVVEPVVNCTCKIYYKYSFSGWASQGDVSALICIGTNTGFKGKVPKGFMCVDVVKCLDHCKDSLPVWTKWETSHVPEDTLKEISVGVYVTGSSWKTGASYGQIYVWIDDVYISGETGVEEKSNIKNQNAKLDAYPNPFTKRATIDIRLGTQDQEGKKSSVSGLGSMVYLRIHDLSGRVVRTLPITDKQLPTTKVTWDGKDDAGKRLPGGGYFAKLVTREDERVLKLILLK